MLTNLIQVPIANEEIREEVFQKFDLNHDSRISFNEL
jgi:Ca2+-binding EF-hand superfamily protein